MIALHVASLIIGSVYILTGSGKNKRIFPLTVIQQQLSEEFCSALVGFHVFTGKFHIL